MLYRIRAPDLAVDAGPVTVSLWLVDVGEQVAAGAPVVELLAGPAVVDVHAPVDGTLSEQLAGEDETIHAGQVLGTILGEDDQRECVR